MFKLIFLLFLFNKSIQYATENNPKLIDALELSVSKNSVEDLLEELIDKFKEDKQFYTNETEVFFERFIKNEPDFNFNAKQMIEFRGFNYEAHKVVTQDCYILEMHRIINPLNATANKPPILLQHGLEESSTSFLINSIGGDLNDKDDRNLGFALAKRGYDVWLGNYRGNTYSKSHTIYSTRDPQFWKFTFDNHALQDLSAEIAYIQNRTNYDQIAYLGFSQGTVTMFELLSLKPDVSKVIKPYIALAPVAYLGDVASPSRFLASSLAFNKFLMNGFSNLNVEMFASSKFEKIVLRILCNAFNKILCQNFVFFLYGASDLPLNSTRLPVYFNHYPAGSSISNFIHYGQNINSRKFKMFDYKSDKHNLECYNSVKPVEVQIENINIKDLYLFSSFSDLLADRKDVERLKQNLKVKFHSKTIEKEKFSHIDFLLSEKVDHYINNDVINILMKNVPAKSVPVKERLRLNSIFDATTCKRANKKSRCHMDLKSVLKSIY